MNWSEFQLPIFDFIENGSGNGIIEAVAGSGKTTTIVEAMRRIPMLSNSVFLAFNKSIADELKVRGVNARTFHSLCCGAVMRHMDANGVEMNKTRELISKHYGMDDAFKYANFVQRLVSLGKQVGIGCLQTDTEALWYEIIYHHDLDLDSEGATLKRAIEIASEVLAIGNKANMIDFDDMLYIPVLDGLRLPQFDIILVDEAQDTNAIQRAILRKIMKPSSRLIAVGDPAQAIYGFRGADSNSMNLIENEFNCASFPLSVSYRCASNIIQYARTWVDHIQAAEGAPEGRVAHQEGIHLEDFTANDLVVCRTVKPLISLAFQMIRARRPVTVLGREIGTGLMALIKKFKTNDISVMKVKLGIWGSRKIEQAKARGDDGKLAAIEDKMECIVVLADEIETEGGDVNALLDVIEKLFSPALGATTFCTIHKAKGLEAPRVFWLNRSECPSKWAKQAWQQKQEDNICYVAATRAKRELIFIEL